MGEYFITYGGLSFYDGVSFQNYRHQDGLANELVNNVIEIGPDSFLIASNTPVLNTLVDGKIGVFTTVDNFCPLINKFLRSSDGSLYVIADDGLFRLDSKRFTKLLLHNPEGKDIGTNLNSIVEWNNYFQIIPWNTSREEKLIIYDKDKNSVAGIIQDKAIGSLGIAPNDELWLSTSDGLEVLDLVWLQKGKTELHPLAHEINEENWKYSYIYFDPNGETWLYQNNNVLHQTASGQSKIFSSAQGLNSGKISDIFVDREGIAWIGSDGSGIAKLPGTNVQVLNELVSGLKNNISSIYQHSDTAWIFNTTNHSFYRIVDKSITSFPLNLSTNPVTQIYVKGENLYFIVDNKLYRVENKDQEA